MEVNNEIETNKNSENDSLEQTVPSYNTTPYSDTTLADAVVWSGNYNNGRYGGQKDENVITNITLHIVDGDWGIGGFTGFAGTERKASSHYGVTTDGSIVQMVHEKDTAWTNGGSSTRSYNVNSVTIEISNLTLKCGKNITSDTFVASDGKEYKYKVINGIKMIEMNGEYYQYPITNEALDATIRLVADIAKRNNLGELYHDGENGTLTWHSDFAGVSKACPGDYVKAMTDYIVDSGNMLNEKGYYIPDFSILAGGWGLTSMVISTENPFDSGTVAADMYSTVSSINNIRNAIGATDIQVPAYESTSTIPGSLMSAQTSLFGISSGLTKTLNNETKVIASIAQVFYDMDQERTNAASALSDGSELNFDDSAYSSMINDLLAYDLTSEIKFDSFLFDPFTHTEGNSGKICLSDLTAMLNGSSLSGALHDNFESERQAANDTKTELDNLTTLISTSSNFAGDVWKTVGAKLAEYSELMSLRIESADKLEAAMAKAIKLIIDYMEDYEELDDSKLPELKEKVEQIKKSIDESMNIINATHTVSVTTVDENGEESTSSVTQYVYSSEARKEARIYINRAKMLIQEINKEINKLENLPIVLAEAEQIINDALVEIYGSYGVKAGNTISGKTVSYIPPQNTNYVAPEYSKIERYNPEIKEGEGKVSEGSYYLNNELQSKYGSYNDYLNGVLKVNNPDYNKDMEDLGVSADETLDDFIAKLEKQDDDVDETPTEPEVETPSQPEPEKPSEPEPEKPSEPEPEKPSEPEPEKPSEPEPEKPSEPEPEKPSEPEPEKPSEPEPEKPSEPEPEKPSEPEPEKPSEPKPEKPSEPEPEKPSEPEPEKPSEPEPEKPSQPEFGVPSEPEVEKPSQKDPEGVDEPSSPSMPSDSVDEPTIPPVVSDVPSVDDNTTVPPIVEIPDDTGVVDITPEHIVETPSTDNNDSINLAKTIGVAIGAGALAGAGALGVHTINKVKQNNIYEDDEESEE